MVLKDNNDINLLEVFLILRKNIIFIWKVFLTLILLLIVLLIVWPKTYISYSAVQLASIGDDPKTSSIFNPVEAKFLFESGAVLNSAVEKYNFLLEEKLTIPDFKEKNLEVEIYKESIGKDEIAVN